MTFETDSEGFLLASVAFLSGYVFCTVAGHAWCMLEMAQLVPHFPARHQAGAVTPDIMHSRNASRRPRSTIPPALE
jgi:hypothetical protein